MFGEGAMGPDPVGLAAVKVTLMPVTPNQEMAGKIMSPGTTGGG